MIGWTMGIRTNNEGDCPCEFMKKLLSLALSLSRPLALSLCNTHG